MSSLHVGRQLLAWPYNHDCCSKSYISTALHSLCFTEVHRPCLFKYHISVPCCRSRSPLQQSNLEQRLPGAAQVPWPLLTTTHVNMERVASHTIVNLLVEGSKANPCWILTSVQKSHMWGTDDVPVGAPLRYSYSNPQESRARGNVLAVRLSAGRQSGGILPGSCHDRLQRQVSAMSKTSLL